MIFPLIFFWNQDRLTSILHKITSISFSMLIEKNENRWFRLQSSSYLKDE
jgi:hypothetical protein